MFKKSKKSASLEKQEARILPKLSLFFFDRPKLTAIIWLCVFVFGILSYTTLLNREGFPTIEIPYSFANGSYLVNDSAKVDKDISKPLSDIALKQDGVVSVNAQSFPNQFSVVVKYKNGTNSEVATKKFEADVKKSNAIPEQAKLNIQTPKFGFTSRGDDFVLSFYSKAEPNTSTKDLAVKAQNGGNIFKKSKPRFF